VLLFSTTKYGQLATEDTSDKIDPVVVEAFKGRVIVQTSAGEYHGLAVAGTLRFLCSHQSTSHTY